MQYSLSNLLDWARRTGGDTLKPVRDTLVTDGTPDVVLSNDGNIVLSTVTLGGVAQTSGIDFTLDTNVITFVTTPPVGIQVIAKYSRSIYSDDDIINFIVDAYRAVASEVALRGWQLNLDSPTDPLVNDPLDQDIPTTDVMDQPLENLIALKSGIKIYTDRANNAGGDAILIKDGDTTIDTSKSASSAERTIKRLMDDYEDSRRFVIANRPKGFAIQNNWVPLPYPWSTPNMMPGEVNGPTY